MQVTRCLLCLGQKVISSPGMMYKDCPECKGVGHIEVKEDVKVKDEEAPKSKPVETEEVKTKEVAKEIKKEKEEKDAISKGSERKSSGSQTRNSSKEDTAKA